MGSRLTEVLIDDLDHSVGAVEQTFMLNGTRYAIDLGVHSQARLLQALAPFIASARLLSSAGEMDAAQEAQPVRPTAPITVDLTQSAEEEDSPVIDHGHFRRWLVEAGHQDCRKNRTSPQLMDVYVRHLRRESVHTKAMGALS